MREYIRKLMGALRKDERGVTLVEYGIAIVLAITLGTGALTLLAGEIGGAMNEAGSQMPGDAVE